MNWIKNSQLVWELSSTYSWT